MASEDLQTWSYSYCLPVVLICLISLSLSGCGPTTTSPTESTRSGQIDDARMKAEMVSIRPVAGEKVRLMIKVTNLSQKHIVSAKALITVVDADGNTLGTKSTYLVLSTKGGLAPSASLEEDAFVDVSDMTKATGMRYAIESIRFDE